MAGHPTTKTWWRNFGRDPRAVQVTVRGEQRSCTARRPDVGTDDHEQAVRAYRRRFPRGMPDPAVPVVVLAPDVRLTTQQDGALHRGQAAEDEVEQDERTVGRTAAAIAHHPAGQEDQRREHGGPTGPSRCAPAGSALPESRQRTTTRARGRQAVSREARRRRVGPGTKVPAVRSPRPSPPEPAAGGQPETGPAPSGP
jgi:hypothetical protein